ncbi:hypothetical protein [Streptomyces sp. NPDC058623]|uniref:hypothetical protein n=1 Tax=Streptomyces sp. NPDC058623 TaxID=3346563 RepID=UPI003663CA7A
MSAGADEAGDAFVDPSGPGGHQGHGQTGGGNVIGEGVEPLVRIAVRLVVAGNGEGVHRRGEGGPHRLLGYRETLVEQEQGHIGRALATAGMTGEAEDKVEALGRRAGGAALTAAQASAGDVARQQAAAPPDFQHLRGHGEPVAVRVVDQQLIGRARGVSGHATEGIDAAPGLDRAFTSSGDSPRK